MFKPTKLLASRLTLYFHTGAIPNDLYGVFVREILSGNASSANRWIKQNRMMMTRVSMIDSTNNCHDIIEFMNNDFPRMCHGSIEKVHFWQDQKGLTQASDQQKVECKLTHPWLFDGNDDD